MMKKSHAKKLVAPIVVACVLGLYYIGFAVACLTLDGFSPAARWLCGGIPLVFVGIIIFVLVERIQEIRSGEEDDLSQY